ncbi:MAG TPA: SAM-dependent chlorinase/fluorinase [Gemmatimonadales bacterium]
MAMPIITLLTDFGTGDSYVAEIKGVLLSRVPTATVVDVTHDVPAGDVRSGRYVLSRAWPRFPAGTVHLAVIDPGVGTARRALAAQAGGHCFVGPDNGLLSGLPDDVRFVKLPVLRDASPTFHGRDVFAPAAARLAAGARLDDLGPPVTDVVQIAAAAPRVAESAVLGEVVYIDHFGNLISNIPKDLIRLGATITVGETTIGQVRRTFGDVAVGMVVAYVGSGGTVEIGVREGSAARALGVGVGAVVAASRGRTS